MWTQVEIPINAAELVEILHHKRQQSGSRIDLTHTIAEVAFLVYYNLTLTVDDVSTGMTVRLHDKQERRIAVVSSPTWPFQIRARELDCDIYVFARTMSKEKVELFGWLPLDIVEEAPIEWFVKDGKRVNYAHRIDSDEYLAELPDQFDFTSCEHLAKYGGIWDQRKQAWDCCACRQYVYDASFRDEFAPLIFPKSDASGVRHQT